MRLFTILCHGGFMGFYVGIAVQAETTWVVCLDVLLASFFAYRLVAVATWERPNEAES